MNAYIQHLKATRAEFVVKQETIYLEIEGNNNKVTTDQLLELHELARYIGYCDAEIITELSRDVPKKTLIERLLRK